MFGRSCACAMRAEISRSASKAIHKCFMMISTMERLRAGDHYRQAGIGAPLAASMAPTQQTGFQVAPLGVRSRSVVVQTQP
jgi:hypothetical protein